MAAVRHSSGVERRARRAALILGLFLVLPGAAGAQILPPIYKPLPVEEGARFRSAADSLRTRAAEIQSRADALREGSRTLRENGTGVAQKLREQAEGLADEANRLESRANADSLTASALRGQAGEFARHAAGREERVLSLRGEVDQLLAAAPDSAALPGPDDLSAEGADGGAAPPAVDPGLPERIRELQSEIRADSQTAVTFRGQAGELEQQAAALESSAAAARRSAAEARRQEAQLRDYEREIASGRTAGEGTAARLEQQAEDLARSAERVIGEAKAQSALAEEWRVQAGRALLPVRSRTEAMRFYGEDGRSVLRNLVFSVSSGGGAGTIHSELVSDYAGPLRLGAGLVLAESGKDEEEADSAVVMERARERFYAGGGNFVLYASLPIAFARSPYHSLTLQTLHKVGLDVPGTGRVAAAGSVPANLDLGVEAYATFNTFGSRFKAFALLRSAYAVGNRAFTENLGAAEGGGLPYAQLTFGTEVASAAKVLLSGAYGSGGVNRAFSLTFQVAPNRS